MINAANTYGFNDKITIQHSQELDKLLNEYRRIIWLIKRIT
ncbi:aspartyl-phosphate phosphatase Spo0E family protein [Anaerobacillus sp. HL2]|nr:aspartyl-phosphate phosphatase Spo0E family protein [Anaerobacillus sp. HL2]